MPSRHSAGSRGNCRPRAGVVRLPFSGRSVARPNMQLPSPGEGPAMSVDPVAEKMSQASADVGISPPKKGESFRCESCGMEVQVTADCHCTEDEHVHFHCCGRE